MPTPSHPEIAPAPPLLVEAAYRQGWLMADVAIQHLRKTGILPGKAQRPEKPVSVPPEILMELAAVMRLSSWQQGGFAEFLGEELTNVLATLDDSERRLAADPNAYAQQETLPPVTGQILNIWERHLAWSGLEELSADVLLDLSPTEEQGMIEELADLLWNHRHTGPHPTGS